MTIEELKTKREDLRKEALELTSTDLDKAEQLRDEIKEIDSQIDTLERQEALKKDLEEIVAEPKEEVVEQEQTTTEVIEEEAAEEPVLDKLEGDDIRMAKTQKELRAKAENGTVIKAANAQEDFRHFLMTGEKRAGVTTADEAVLVPEEFSNTIEDFTEDLESLDKFVTIKNVTTPIGKFPVRTDETKKAGLPTVAELEESPELGLRKLGDQQYEIKTHRGLIKASWEALDDGVEVEKIIAEELAEEIVATKNKKILDALATLQTVDVANIDGLKTILNVTLKSRYAKQIIVSNDVYDKMDQMKDNQGRYLLQEAITSASGYKFLGKDVVVLDQDLIGKNTMYVGSLKDAVILFMRKQLLVNYEVWNQYGKVFSPIIRLDARIKNPKAVIKVNFTGGTPTV